MIAILGMTLAALGNTGCESCEFSYGYHPVTAHVVADVAPRDLKVTVCYERYDEKTCQAMDESVEGGQGTGGSGGAAPEERSFRGDVSPEGTFSCYIPAFRVTAQAANCPTVETQFAERDADGEEIAATTEVTLTLDCDP